MTTPTPSEARQVALLPCPFCGYAMSAEEDGAYQKAGFMGAQTPVWSVSCGDTKCNAEVSTTSKETAIAAWNRRALRQGGEAVAWQCRHRSSEPHEPWWNIPRETYEAQRSAALWSDVFEYRALAALPPPPAEGEAA